MYSIASLTIWTNLVGDCLVRYCLLPLSLIEIYVIFLEQVFRGLLNHASQNVVFVHAGAPAAIMACVNVCQYRLVDDGLGVMERFPDPMLSGYK